MNFMKKVFAGLMLLTAIVGYNSCKKQNAENETQAVSEIRNAPAPLACATKYLDLFLDALGNSYVSKIDNSPSNPPITNTFLGQIGAVTLMTGLSYDPNTGICYGITGNVGSNPNSLIKFNLATPALVSIIPLISTSGAINLSDIERNPNTSTAIAGYYAINRAVANNNRIVKVNVSTGVVTFLPLNTGQPLRGLAMDPGGKIYVMRSNAGGLGAVSVIDPTTGGVIAGFNQCPYPGVISPGGAVNAEMGLHFDDVCTQRLVTGNFTGTGFQLTDGMPACLGGPSYTAAPGTIKPTVDFSRLN
jgi:hypothetical protein